jgi:hypothetical protein
MLPPQLCKFSTLYDSYGLGAVKNIWLLISLLLLARTVNFNKMKELDGPSWKFGAAKVHYLVLRVLIGNVAVLNYVS